MEEFDLETELEWENDAGRAQHWTGQSATLVNTLYSVPKNWHVKHVFSLDWECEVTLRSAVRDDDSVDVFVTTDAEYQRFEQGRRFRVLRLSLRDSMGGAVTHALPARDDYVLVADHSETGVATPANNLYDDYVHVRLELELNW